MLENEKNISWLNAYSSTIHIFGLWKQINYAEFERPNGEIISGKVLKWTDYEGEQVQLKMEDGNIYIVNSNKLILSVDPF